MNRRAGWQRAAHVEHEIDVDSTRRFSVWVARQDDAVRDRGPGGRCSGAPGIGVIPIWWRVSTIDIALASRECRVPRQKRVFTPEYRAEAVQLVLAADKPIAEMAGI